MKTKPILFSTSMVQSILEGRKTQTRRIVKKQFLNGDEPRFSTRNLESTGVCPFGNIGDVLWVRETFRPKGHSFPIGEHFEYKATAQADGNPTDEPWKPSIFMPKDAARIWLKITDVRVEKLNDISDEDSKKEGIDFEIFNNEPNTFVYQNYLKYSKPFFSFSEYSWNFGKETHSAPVASYCSLWEEINGDGSWNKNPWVWVIEFERIEKPLEV